MQMTSVGIVFLTGKRPIPQIPLWLCWVSFFCCSISIGQVFQPFFQHGSVAWNGLINYWILLGGFFLWVATTTVYLFKAITHIDQKAALTVLLIAAIKVRPVMRQFMELRTAPLPWPLIFDGWLVLVLGIAAAQYVRVLA